jgi:GNAT superfamily N-acetyltransferase
MLVRDYVPTDRAACLAVFQSNVPKFFVPSEREEFSAFLDALPGPYFVLESDTRDILGCGGYALAPGSSTADLCWGMISRALHGRGLGRLLLSERIARMSADPSVAAVALNTSQFTRRFYEQAGFITERFTPDGYAPGLDRCDMRLVLAPSAPA